MGALWLSWGINHSSSSVLSVISKIDYNTAFNRGDGGGIVPKKVVGDTGVPICIPV